MYPASHKKRVPVLRTSDATRSATKKQSGWEPTRYQNLFRYVPSGMIFARLKIAGKQVRKSLKTTDLELARRKLIELERNERAVTDDRRRGKILFGDGCP